MRGIVRGGFLNAGWHIDVDELGTPLGVESSARVAHPEGRIIVGVRHPNTLLEVGGQRHRNLVPEYKVCYLKEALAR
ncbi:MAG: hypothetical protein K6T83_23465 [Alicyclobacillus sp.]|nr:hypothetical protein [Alicyclobacillus sp.]